MRPSPGAFQNSLPPNAADPAGGRPSEPEPSRRSPRAGTGARRGRYRAPLIAALYYLSCWSIVGALWPAQAGGVWLVFAVAVATTAPIVSFVARRGWQRYPSAAFRLFVMRPILYFQLLLPVVAGAGLLGVLAGTPFHAALSTGRIAAGFVLSAMVLLFIVGYVGSSRLVVQRVDAAVPDLPETWDGLRIAQLSDLHVGPHTPRRYLDRVADVVEALKPDLIAITGDMVDDRAEDVEHFAAGIARLTAPLGVYLIPGNHDIYAGWPDVVQRLRAALPEAVLLVNDARILTRNGAPLAIVGTGDPAGRYGRSGVATDGVAPDIDRALGHVPPQTPVIALAHNPVLWPELAARGVALTLSGHTHWGQFALPKLGWSLAGVFLPHSMGAYADVPGAARAEGPLGADVGSGALLYISPGTGYWGLPFRIGANPEVSLVTVSRGTPSAIKTGLRTTGAALDRFATQSRG
jgi:predicted MPP superfamily phosphohydrolase